MTARPWRSASVLTHRLRCARRAGRVLGAVPGNVRGLPGWLACLRRRAACRRTRSGTLDAAQARAYYLSANVIKASEDKTFAGATAASLASPWGQAVPAGQTASDGLAPYFGSYREVFPRDAYETFTGFLVDGDLATARHMVRYWFDDLQLPNGSFPRNGLLNGEAAPDTGGLQLDETADPILAAWQAGLAGDASLYADHIKPAADFLVANGPADGVERWEEQSGFSPSTMADEVAGPGRRRGYRARAGRHCVAAAVPRHGGQLPAADPCHDDDRQRAAVVAAVLHPDRQDR